MLRFLQMKTLQKFASVHASVHNHFSLERHLTDRQTYRERRSAELLQIQRISAKLDRNDLPSAVRAVFGSDREPFEKKSAGLRGDLRVGVPRNLEQGC